MLRFFKESKGQTAMEVLLITAGVILIVTIIGIYLKNKMSETQEDTNDMFNETLDKAGGK